MSTTNSDITKVSNPFDPERCLGHRKSHGQCWNRAMPGSKYCVIHTPQNKARERRMYNLRKWQQRTDELSGHDKAMSLTQEIGITRMALEEVITQCNDSKDLLRNNSVIMDMVSKIGILVSQAQKLEVMLGRYLSRDKIQQFAMEIQNILPEYLDDEQLIEIADKIEKALDRVSRPTDPDLQG